MSIYFWVEHIRRVGILTKRNFRGVYAEDEFTHNKIPECSSDDVHALS